MEKDVAAEIHQLSELHIHNARNASRLEQLAALPTGETRRLNIDALGELLRNVAMYGDETSTTIRLVPTEGRESPLQKSMYASVQNERYLHAPPENSEKAIRYPDIERLQRTYDVCRRLGQKLFCAKYFVPDFLSGMNVQLICLLAFTQADDLVLSIDPRHGGHESTSTNVRNLGRRSMFLPFNRDLHEVDCDSLDTTISPKLIYLDHSNALGANDTESIKRVYPNSILIADVSQVLAIVAAGLLPNPLLAGADLLVGSTHKSLNGPQKAIAATSDSSLHSMLKACSGSLISSNHIGSVAALAVCLCEFAEFGMRYASQLVANANAIANNLIDDGVPVYLSEKRKFGSVTSTQHVWIDCEQLHWNAETAVHALYKAGIVVNTLFLCRGGDRRSGAKGLRLGTTEVTRLGMREVEMKLLAAYISSILTRKVQPEHIRPVISILAKKFRKVRFCFEPELFCSQGARPLSGDCSV
jgi:glycine hydroxymethyltransferase